MFGRRQYPKGPSQYQPPDTLRGYDDTDSHEQRLHSELCDAALELRDQAYHIANAERNLRQALGGIMAPSSFMNERPRECIAPLPVEFRKGLDKLKEPLARQLLDLENAAMRYFRTYTQLPPTETMFTTLAGEAGELQDYVRRAHEAVQEACYGDSTPPRWKFWATFNEYGDRIGPMGSGGFGY